jgi:hypothetical protein
MPLDKFFTSGWKRKASEGQKQRAFHKKHWPVGSQFKPSEETVQLWMREGKTGQWFHVRNMAPEESRMELDAWRDNNPGWEFKSEDREPRQAKKEKPLGPDAKRGYGPPRKKWD